MAFRVWAVLLLLAVSSCGGSATPTSEGCASALLGARGGALAASNGATIIVPPGALSTATEVALCPLPGFAPRRDQRAELLVVRPVGLTLTIPATFTIPVDASGLENLRTEIGGSVDDAAPDLVTDVRGGPASVSFEHARLGYVRVFGSPTSPSDAGSDSEPVDAARGDAGPRPLAPVVVGVDLDPANYACLGAGMLPPAGSAVDVDLHLIDWQEHSSRAGYRFRILPRAPSPDVEVDCSGLADCVLATTDDAGHASVTIPSGLAWLDVLGNDPSLPVPDDRHLAPRHVHLPIVIPPTGGSVEVEAISQRTFRALGGESSHFGQLSLGRVIDCDARQVQRARVRVFDAMSGGELGDGVFGFLSYGSTFGVPTEASGRTGADGTFLVDNVFESDIRIEAWGQLVVGGPEVMLACELRTVTSHVLVVGDLRPVGGDRPSSCSE